MSIYHTLNQNQNISSSSKAPFYIEYYCIETRRGEAPDVKTHTCDAGKY